MGDRAALAPLARSSGARQWLPARLPAVARPYAAIAPRLGSTERRGDRRASASFCAHGVVSRVGAVFRPHSVGASTLAAMRVPAERLAEVAARSSRAHAGGQPQLRARARAQPVVRRRRARRRRVGPRSVPSSAPPACPCSGCRLVRDFRDRSGLRRARDRHARPAGAARHAAGAAAGTNRPRPADRGRAVRTDFPTEPRPYAEVSRRRSAVTEVYLSLPSRRWRTAA